MAKTCHFVFKMPTSHAGRIVDGGLPFSGTRGISLEVVFVCLLIALGVQNHTFTKTYDIKRKTYGH